MPDNVRQEFPMATYRTASMLIQGYDRIGIADEYYPEDLEDNLPGFEWLASKASELPRLVMDTEEDLKLRMYNEGETRIVGHAATPLFVDGSANSLQLIGDADYFSGTAASNIISGGGVSYAMLHLGMQYGDNFVNEEGRPQPRRLVQIVGRKQNIDLVAMYINAPSNVENFDPNRPNPAAELQGVKLLSTQRMAQPNDLIFFYEGWEDHIKMRAKYQGRAETWEEGKAQKRKIVSQVRSRLGFYGYNNRLVVLMRGGS
jgi:curved DNA-binding protein CbpA